MTLAELEAALAWLERNRLADFLHLLDGDAVRLGGPQRAAWRPRTGRGGQGPRKSLGLLELGKPRRSDLP